MIDELREALADRYAIDGELKGGGMSHVFTADDLRLNRRVAIKVVPRELIGGASVERFNREILLSARLQHPHIVPVLEAGEALGLPYFVMPFVEGESLRSRLTRGPLSIRETAAIMRDVARALAFAHENGVIHRDIKPDNVLISAGAAVVTDFGVAKAVNTTQRGGRAPASGTVTGVGVSIGTPQYMSPEQAAADPEIDHRSDIYSLGVLGYEMLVGAPPFHTRTPQATLAAQISEVPRPLATLRYDVPISLAEMIMRCLSKDRAKRPGSANEVVRFLETAAAVTGDVARPPLARKKRPWLIPAVAIGVLAIAAGGWWFMRPRRSAPAATPLPTPGAASASALTLVQPFDVSGDTATASRLGAGIGAELTSTLASRTRVRVATPGAPASPEPRLLGMVQVEGSVVRVHFRLVDSANTVLWTGRVTGSTTNTFALQDSARAAVLEALSRR